MKKIIALLLIVLLIVAAVSLAFVWTVNRVYIHPGQSLQLRYKGLLLFNAPEAKKGYWAQKGEIGVREKLRGPGRHFYCPLWWKRTIVDDVLVQPGQVGIVTCKLGEALATGCLLYTSPSPRD